ncbi:MAG: GGDEF domain-containing protein [Lacrimispora sp.]|uniref:GGDEF domain-containing protein n=1 Tax=Lacrimispora sp. TaxID=2719234 RepID=UPI0039E71BA9
MKYISLEEMKDKLDFFEKMHDGVRLVDPLNKRVLEYRDSAMAGLDDVCYDYWGNGKICENCVSLRSHCEGKSFMKMEKSGDKIFLVTAIPLDYPGHPVVLELFKDTTDSMLVGSGNYNEGEMMTRCVKELNDIIVRDPLTSLYNRRFSEERLPVDVAVAIMADEPLSVCFIDMDNFKEINDLYGHESGDMAIKAAGEVILRHMDYEDAWAARYGGDEFLLNFKNMDEDQVREIVEHIQEEIKELSFARFANKTRLSISFGIETMKGDPMTAADLIRRADEKMYRAKKAKIQ